MLENVVTTGYDLSKYRMAGHCYNISITRNLFEWHLTSNKKNAVFSLLFKRHHFPKVIKSSSDVHSLEFPPRFS